MTKGESYFIVGIVVFIIIITAFYFSTNQNILAGTPVMETQLPPPLEVPLYLTARTDNAYNQPLGNVSITVFSGTNELFTTASDNNGVAKFSQSLTNGHSYQFLLQKDGYYSETISITLSYDIKPTINSEAHSTFGNANSEVNLNYTITNLNYTLDRNFELFKICEPNFHRTGNQIEVFCGDGIIQQPFAYLMNQNDSYKRFYIQQGVRIAVQAEQFVFDITDARYIGGLDKTNFKVCIDDYDFGGGVKRITNTFDEGMKEKCVNFSDISNY